MTVRERRNRMLNLITFSLIALQAVTATIIKTPPNSPLSCEYSANPGYFIPKEKTTYANAKNLCAKHKGYLANSYFDNELRVTSILNSCLGFSKSVWIDHRRGGSYKKKAKRSFKPQGACLAINTGNDPDEDCAVDTTCTGERQVLCQRQRPEVYNPFLPEDDICFPGSTLVPGVYTIGTRIISLGIKGNIDCLGVVNPTTTTRTTVTLTIPPATYTISGSVTTKSITVTNPAGDRYTVTFPFAVPSFHGPGVYTLYDGRVIKVEPTGHWYFVVAFPTSHSYEEHDVKFPFRIPGFHGPGTYTLYNGKVIVVRIDGSWSYIVEKPTKVPLPTVTLTLPFKLPGFHGAGIYTLTDGRIVKILPDGTWLYLNAQPTVTIKPSIVTFPFKVPNFHGAGVYTLVDGRVISVQSNGVWYFINAYTTSKSPITINFPFKIPNFHGAGVYTLADGRVIKVETNGNWFYINSYPTSTKGPVVGVFPFKIPNFHGAGVYTLEDRRVIRVNLDGSWEYIKVGVVKSQSVVTIHLPFKLPNFHGAGIYTLLDGRVIKIEKNGQWFYINAVPTTINKGPKTISLPFKVPGFHGAGVYTLSDNRVIRINLDGSWEYLKESVRPTRPPTVVKFPFQIPGFHGPGVYTLVDGRVVKVEANGNWSFINASASYSTIEIPSITLPSITYPTAILGPYTIVNYKGPGLYTIGYTNVIRIGSAGNIVIVSGTGLGNPGASITIPTASFNLNLPTITLPGGFVINGYRNSGDYTLKSGPVVRVDSRGKVFILRGAPAGYDPRKYVQPGGFKFPSFNLPKIITLCKTLPSFPKIVYRGKPLQAEDVELEAEKVELKAESNVSAKNAVENEDEGPDSKQRMV